MATAPQIALSLALVAGAVNAIGSCRQVAGLDEELRVQSCAAVDQAVTACGPCLDLHCCTELIACEEDVSCAAWLSCFSACAPSDAACRTACEAAQPFTEPAAALRACQATFCSTDCALVCGGASAPGEGCDPCADACCDEEAACQRSLDCNLLRVCVDACADAEDGCVQTCRNAHAEGASLRQAVEGCRTRRCNVTSDLSCVGAVDWATTIEDRLELSLTVQDAVTFERLEGVAIDACHHSDPACDPPPSGSYVTDAGGRAQITLDLNGSNYPGFLAVSAADRFPALWYFFPPLADDAGATIVAPSRTSVEAIVEAIGQELEPDRGHLLALVIDCDNIPAGAMEVRAETADARTVTRYLEETLVIPGATETAANSGRALLLNLPAGVTRVVVEQARTCARIAQADVLVRPGTMTVVPLPPTP